ncbi:MAG TPA: hypothetical protein VMS12_00065 [Thermoanaerobaculia bacterium]|nr:hypothetical protein [Thermoanaerobaculia bacterium]
MQIFSKALQLIGMSILPVALYVGLIKDDVRREVMLLFIGAALFFLGWTLSQKRGE